MIAGKSRPSVLLVTTGGTITMFAGEQGGFGPAGSASSILDRVPEIRAIADVEVLPLGDVDSSDIQPDFWAELARVIYESYERFDGFVVAHGTDTMVFSASALSFMLQELSRPIVFTGAQIPLSEIGSDGRSNLINAARVAVADLGEVCIVFGNQVIRGSRARKASAFDLYAFEAVKQPPIGRIGLTLQLAEHARRRGPTRLPLFQPELCPQVARVPVWPGMDPGIIEHLASTHAGIVIEGFGVGTIPTASRSLLPAIREATRAGVPVIICTQCIVGSTAMELYQVGLGALEAGAIPAMDMTPEATQVKLMWALGQTRDIRRIESMMTKDYVGEIQLRLQACRDLT